MIWSCLALQLLELYRIVIYICRVVCLVYLISGRDSFNFADGRNNTFERVIDSIELLLEINISCSSTSSTSGTDLLRVQYSSCTDLSSCWDTSIRSSKVALGVTDILWLMSRLISLYIRCYLRITNRITNNKLQQKLQNLSFQASGAMVDILDFCWDRSKSLQKLVQNTILLRLTLEN